MWKFRLKAAAYQSPANFYRTLIMASTSITNRLINERSPYLLQHSKNPVNWYPWGQDAFDKAKAENKLIFLSVGYSTCHWCHVMERESFENPEIGKLMNDHFISIKVDREERPDVDKIYMTFVQATTGSGGWPMSVWLTPDLKPIVGGTYFPPDDRYFGRPGFSSILKFVAQQWREKPDEVLKQGKSLTDALLQATNVNAAVGDAQLPNPESIDRCHDMITNSYDPLWGGFGNAPKFPQPVNFDFMVRYAQWKFGNEKLSETKAVEMVAKTLEFMANGGIHDHIAKGFHRYSTDKKWHVPHFEKMLYDQAQLAVAYADMYQITKKDVFRDIVCDILSYVSRDLSHPAGGFYSAEDADSLPTVNSTEHREGAFCVWTDAEIRSILSDKVPSSSNTDLTEAEIFCRYYNVKEDGNLEPYQDPHAELTGQNVLIVYQTIAEVANQLQLSESTVAETLQKCREKLFAVRLQRPKPHLDNKILTSWNGLMISGYAKAAIALNDPTYADRAVRAAQFIQDNLMTSDKRLLRSAYVADDGAITQLSQPILAFADDYAFFIAGLLDLYDVTFDSKWLGLAEFLQVQMDELFWDEDQLGYFTSPAADSSVILRLKEDQDGAEPSANSVAANNLIRLSVLLNSSDHMEKCHQILSAFGKRLSRVPIVLPKMLIAYMLYLRPPVHVNLVGELDDPKTQEFIKALRTQFLPNVITTVFHSASELYLKSRHTGLEPPKMVNMQPTAYVCKNYTCGSPIGDADTLMSKVLEPSQSP